MEKKRYTVLTFRGYDNFDNLYSAFKSVRGLINDIDNDGWCSAYWWARIIDNHVGVSRLVYKMLNGRFRVTGWIDLK